MIILHHLRIGRSMFAVWQLEEFGIEYELKVYHRDPETFLAQEDLKSVHPLGKSPVIEDGDLMLSESGAITSYLLEKFDNENRFAPPRTDIKRWANFTQWLHYPEGSVFGPLLVRMILLRSEVSHAGLDAYSKRETQLHLSHISNQLGDNEFILGDSFSAADFGISYVVSLARRLGQLKPYPTLEAYLLRNFERPAYLRAIEKAIE
ncbi:MAG: glutathione S-transferase family protein [Pseudohongiellaceae bacterium]